MIYHYAYELSNLLFKTNQPIVVILDNEQQCELCHQQIKFYTAGLKKKIVRFNSYELNEEDLFNPSDTIVAQRMEALKHLIDGTFDLLLTSIDAVSHLLPPQSFVAAATLRFSIGQNYPLSKLVKTLTAYGYERVSEVNKPLTYAIKGEILDIFAPQSNQPIRVNFDDLEIETLHYFDPNTQRSTQSLTEVVITPLIEYDPLIAKEHTAYKQISETVLKALQQGHTVPTWHHHLHALHSEIVPISAYVPSEIQVYTTPDFFNHFNAFIKRSSKRLEAINIDPKLLLLNPNQIDQLNKRTSHLASQTKIKNIELNKKTLQQQISDLSQHYDILFVCQNYYRLNELEQQLLQAGITTTQCDSWVAFASKRVSIGITIGQVNGITLVPELKKLIIPEQYITQKVSVTPRKKEVNTALPASQLKIGDLLIHEDHGIGQFTGIETRTINGQQQDFIVINYVNDDKLLFPPTLLHKIHPYHGQQSSIDALKSTQWSKRKKKALENIDAYAAKLLQSEASRNQSNHQPLVIPDEYENFISHFPFTETPDQQSIMQAIIQDMQQTVLFDRLICGDVGFGKTEVALRSAFITAMNGRQVVLVAPTTILANQHYETFKKRCNHTVLNIALVTRATKISQEQIANGKIDIVIGTHKAIKLKYHKLGLVIVDEEHRFGVKQKDSIQAFEKSNRLSLTATPIPRSLNMALSKFRSISIMHEPPKKRLPIHTEIVEADQMIINRAIEREIRRGGQVFILMNEITQIPKILETLKKECPFATFGTLHGQMPTDVIERQMANFYTQAFNVLIASTIIESGIDIPNANTLIVYRADKLGLSQLHQLRGRVGRSHHQGFAYFLTPQHKTITKDAQMRLEAITTHTTLGSGFQLALADLEIRGAGNLLGEEQSGHVNAIGLSLYTHLLNKALPNQQHLMITEVNSTRDKRIPQQYIDNTETRYQTYHRLANMDTLECVNQLADELIDRFGHIPSETLNLIDEQKMQIIANKYQLKSVRIDSKIMKVNVGSDSSLPVSEIIKLLQKNQTYILSGPTHIDIQHNGSPYTALNQFISLLHSQ